MDHTTFLSRGLAVLLVGLSIQGTQAQIGINATNAVPDASAMLDLNSVTKGLLVPRMTQGQRVAIPAPANGLIVFQNAGTVLQPKGYWYYDSNLLPAAGWVPVTAGYTGWQLGGNAGILATNFLGTIDNVALVFRTNGVERMRITNGVAPNGGLVAINTVTPQEILDINGAINMSGTSTGNNAGSIRFNAATNAHDGNVDNTANWYQLENVFNFAKNQNYFTQPQSTCAPPSGGVTTWPEVNDPTFPDVNLVGTIETPYARLWEDARHQYHYRASDLAVLNICPNTNITALAFYAVSATGNLANVQVNMKNTLANTLPTFDLVGFQNCWSGNVPSVVANTWNQHTFTTPFQWLGGSYNVLVEFCHDLNDWTSNAGVWGENTNYNSLYGIYCDACGHLFIPGSSTCYFASCPNNSPQNTPGVLCVGYGHSPGCQLTASSSLLTCDGTFTWLGAQGVRNQRPRVRFNAQTNATLPVLTQGRYLWSDKAVMVERTPGWAASGAFPNQVFKGPGTIGAEVGVWGGTVLLSDHVFDIHFDGAPRPEDATRAANYRHYPIREMANYVERERHLPTMDGRQKWMQEGPFSLDDLSTQLWVTVEEQALYIKELNERMDLLRRHLLRKRLAELEGSGQGPKP